MDLLLVARESADLAPTQREVSDEADARALLPKLPHGAQLAGLVARMGLGVLVLSKSLDRTNSRAAIGIAIQRSRPRAAVLLGHDIGRELLGEGLSLKGGIRELHSRPIAAIGQVKQAELEALLQELCQKAGVIWAPPGTRAATARAVVRAEEVETLATSLIEKQQWQAVVDLLRSAEPLGARGTNMLGRALLQLGDREGARHAFERTLAGDPGNTIAQRQLAQLGS
jgi:hypothetical protein